MTADNEELLRARLHRAIDPIVPDRSSEARVMRTLTENANMSSSSARWFAAHRMTATVLVAAVVAVLLGGALGITLSLRNRSTHTPPPGPAAHSPSASATLAPTATASPTPNNGLAVCNGASLSAQWLDQVGAAGSAGADIALRNIGTASCSLEGYATMKWYTCTGTTKCQVPSDSARPVVLTHDGNGTLLNNNGGRLPTVQSIRLNPGDTAFIAVQFSDVNSGNQPCPTINYLLITPPNAQDTVTLTLATPITVCGPSGTPTMDEAPVSAHPFFTQ